MGGIQCQQAELMLGMDQRYRAALDSDRKTVMAWQYTTPVEGYAPPVEGMPAPAIHQTYVSVADPMGLQGYYIQPGTVAPLEGVPASHTFLSPTDPVAKVRPYLQPSNLPQEGLVYVNSRPSTKQEGYSVSAHSSRDDDYTSNLADHASNQSEETPSRVKLLCSYGGKILPRPSDGRLRYVGGDTRMITVSRDTSFENLMSKMTEVQRQTTAIKYQLPDEDLDALVSVSSEEDLENMMEEYDKLEAGDAHPRLRVFLFTPLDYDSQIIGDASGDPKNSEQQYLDAVNGVLETSSMKQPESLVQSVAISSPQSNAFIQETTPIAVRLPQVPQGVPVVPQYMTSSSVQPLANGSAISPFMTTSGLQYGYAESTQSGSDSTDTSLLKADRMLGQFQYVLAGPAVETENSDISVLQPPRLHHVQQLQVSQAPLPDLQNRVLVPQYQAYVEQPTLQPQNVGLSEVQQRDDLTNAGLAQWPPDIPISATYGGAPQQHMWSPSDLKVHSDPSPGHQTILPHNTAYTEMYLKPDQVFTEPISSYEYQAVGEKLSLQKPKELQGTAKADFRENVPSGAVNWNLPKQVHHVETTSSGWDENGKIDNLHLSGLNLTGWSAQSSVMAEIPAAPSLSTQIVSQQTPIQTPDPPLPDSLVNFLEDSLSAIRTEPFPVSGGYPRGSGSDSSAHMAHSASSSNNMILDLLTSDDVFCKTSCTSTISGGSTGASSASTSSSHALEATGQVFSDTSPVTRVLPENLNEGLLISLHDGDTDAKDPFQLPPQSSAQDHIMKQMAGLSVVEAESFAFTKTEEKGLPFSGELERDMCDRSLDTSDLQTAKAGLTEVTEMPDPELESPTISAAESEAIARARGLQIIKHEDLEEIRELGSGTFGTVYHGKWRGTDVAIKRIKASCFFGPPSEQARLKEDFWSEACTLAALHHPNVVAFYGVVPDSPGGTLATVTEFMVNGSLKQVLHKKEKLMDRRRRLILAMDAAFGMEYLHDRKIIHFDLKGENLLVNMRDTQRPVCKVGDLGLSKVKHKTMVTGGVRGTLPWMAPELLNGKSISVSEKVDVFSFGIVMWELLTGEEPYADLHYGAIIGGIVNNALRPEVPKYCEPEWKSLMERCWADDPASRPSFSEIARELRSMTNFLAKQVQQQQAQGQQNNSQGQQNGQAQPEGQQVQQAAQ